jgi:hypothetical protein
MLLSIDGKVTDCEIFEHVIDYRYNFNRKLIFILSLRKIDSMGTFVKNINTQLDINRFDDWLNDKNLAYQEGLSSSPNTSVNVPETLMPLFRTARVRPADVFKKGGVLSPTGGDRWRHGASFSLRSHQKNSYESSYTSTSRDVRIAVAHGKSGYFLYIIDPQPHGRDQNAFNVSMGNENAFKDFSNEQEVSVPGEIKTEDIRGAVKVIVGETQHGVNLRKIIENPYYVSQIDRRAAEARQPEPSPDEVKKAVLLREEREEAIRHLATRYRQGK